MFPKKLTRQVICNLDEPIVQTKAGKLRGLIVEDTYIFRGVKYADAKRFRLPEPVQPWDGVKDAIVYGPVSCEMNTPIPHDAYNVPHFFYPQDEDCQYLNIWTQHTDEKAKKPVMVWIHGGGFVSGSSVELFAYDGENLSRFGDVVVVSINHRLNAIGYLDLSAYGEEYRYTGNLGTADMVAALQWIHENIAAFGGDPDNVTILGQSGGGMKVTSLIQCPYADGLFHKAVIQSGVLQGDQHITKAEAGALTKGVLDQLGLDADHIAEIEKIPYYKLARACLNAIDALSDKMGALSFGPVYDDDYYKGNPFQVGFREQTKHIPMIIGSCLGEFNNNFCQILAEGSKNDWSEELKAKLFAGQFGAAADQVIAAFKKAYPGKNTADALFVDKLFRVGTADYADLRASSGCANVYEWMFSLEMPLNNGTLPWHNVDEAYMFHNAEYLEASYIPGVSEWMQDIMTGAWVAFARSGDPNHVGMPIWEPHTAQKGEIMVFDEQVGMRYGHDRELMAALPDKPLSFGGDREAKIVLGGGPRQSL